MILKTIGVFFLILAVSIMLSCLLVDIQQNDHDKKRKDDKKHDRRD